ncbi:hypothetical protein PAJ34TS1_10900 [Paenibacillus azoreducens]
MNQLHQYNHKIEKPMISLHNALSEIMNSYITARNQSYAHARYPSKTNDP